MQYMNFDSVVSRLGAALPGLDFCKRQSLLTITRASKTVSGVHLPGTIFSVVKRPECEAKHSLCLVPSL